jgi:type I restriction-modification system DNA methylase subunit
MSIGESVINMEKKNNQIIDQACGSGGSLKKIRELLEKHKEMVEEEE